MASYHTVGQRFQRNPFLQASWKKYGAKTLGSIEMIDGLGLVLASGEIHLIYWRFKMAVEG